jgi:hypothetical protein
VSRPISRLLQPTLCGLFLAFSHKDTEFTPTFLTFFFPPYFFILFFYEYFVISGKNNIIFQFFDIATQIAILPERKS